MGLVTDVYWNCPKCARENRAQLSGICGNGDDLKLHEVPLGSDLRWNPACSGCGLFQLVTKVICVPVADVSPPDEEADK